MPSQTADSGLLYRFFVLTVMPCALGTVVSLVAIGFVEWVRWMNIALLVAPRSRVQFDNPPMLSLLTIAVPALGGLLVGFLLQKLSSAKRAMGPADVIRAVQLRQPLVAGRPGFITSLAAALSLGCGASVGQYGPLVYLGAHIGSLANRLQLNIPNLQSVAVACGVAAAISTAFNAPIAGLVFAHEVILRHYSLQSFAPTTVASATGFVVANVVFDRPPIFLVAFDGVRYGHEFALFALLGVACALLAILFMRSILLAARLAPRLPVPAVCRPALAGLMVGVVALALPDVLGVGVEALRFATIEGAFSNAELALLVVAKLALTAICIGFGFAGGVFSPSLLIGILFGALFGSLLMVAGIPNSGIAVYAISGMMAMASPVIGAPLTTILIVFELTRSYELTIAAMVSVVFANLLAFRLAGRSLFDIQLANQGVDLSAGRDRALLVNSRVIDQNLSNPYVVAADARLEEVIRQLTTERRSEAVVLADGGVYLGILRLQDAMAPVLNQLSDSATPSGTVADVMKKDWLCLDENDTLWDAMNRMRGFVGEGVPVLGSQSGQLLGMITEGDIIDAYLQTVHKVRTEEHESL